MKKSRIQVNKPTQLPRSDFIVGDKVKHLTHGTIHEIQTVNMSLFGWYYSVHPVPENESKWQFSDNLTLADVQL